MIEVKWGLPSKYEQVMTINLVDWFNQCWRCLCPDAAHVERWEYYCVRFIAWILSIALLINFEAHLWAVSWVIQLLDGRTSSAVLLFSENIHIFCPVSLQQALPHLHLWLVLLGSKRWVSAYPSTRNLYLVIRLDTPFFLQHHRSYQRPREGAKIDNFESQFHWHFTWSWWSHKLWIHFNPLSFTYIICVLDRLRKKACRFRSRTRYLTLCTQIPNNAIYHY